MYEFIYVVETKWKVWCTMVLLWSKFSYIFSLSAFNFFSFTYSFFLCLHDIAYLKPSTAIDHVYYSKKSIQQWDAENTVYEFNKLINIVEHINHFLAKDMEKPFSYLAISMKENKKFYYLINSYKQLTYNLCI